MDLVREILKEHSKAQAHKIVRFVGKDEGRFTMLVNVFKAGPYRVTQRAAWPLSICVERHPEFAKAHLKELIIQARKPDAHNAVRRNIMRLLQYVELPKRFHGKIADLCFQYLSDNGEAIAVRVFAMTVLERIASQNPEISRELRMIIQDHLPFASPAYLSRARKVLKKLPNDISN
jgi:hypothetical protein